MAVEIPANGWRPRPYQMPAWAALEGGCKRLALSWHRRSGKDDLSLNWAAVSAMTRVGGIWHMLPQANQSRKAIWDAVDPHTGRRRIDAAFPPELRETTREQDMFIRFRNGSTWQVVGSDNYNSLIGSPPMGVVFSEYALADPNAWAFLRPILAENNGWAIFISTPRGRNHFARLLDYAKGDPAWFGQVLTVEDTKAIPLEVIRRERKELKVERGDKEAEAIIRQEYYCDFDADIPGSYYGDAMSRAEQDGRVGAFPHIVGQPVGTAWDIGIGDSTVIWFYQFVGHKIRIINVLEGSGVGLDWYAKKLLAMDYVYGDHIWPHDGAVKEWGSGKSRLETAAGYGLKPRVLEADSVDDGIQAVRQMLPVVEWCKTPDPFPGESAEDAAARMSRALDAIRQYRREYSDKLQRFGDRPLHDWCFVGDTSVLTRYGAQQIMSLPGTGEVLTSCGWMPYENPRITRKDAPLVAVRFSDGLSVKCTPDHLFKTESGWKSAESLPPGSRIQSSLTPSRSISMAVYTVVGRAISIGRGAARNCIEMFGALRLGRFQMAATYTIGTATLPITPSKIWNASLHQSITRLLGGQTSTSIERVDLARRLGIAPQNGTSQKLGDCGTGVMLSEPRAGQNGSENRNRALSVVWYLMRWFGLGTHRNTAANTAKWLTIESVEPLQERADVWCMSVPGAEEFSLSNGAIVHNCSHFADALRYLAKGRRPFRGTGRKAMPAAAVADYSVLG